MRNRAAALALVLAGFVMAGACGYDDNDTDDGGAAGTTTTAADSVQFEIQLSQSCVLSAEAVEIEVHYPDAWHANDETGGGVDPCTIFHNEEFETPPPSDGIMASAGSHATFLHIELSSGRVVSMRTHEVGDLDYEENVEILRAMADALDIRLDEG